MILLKDGAYHYNSASRISLLISWIYLVIFLPSCQLGQGCLNFFSDGFGKEYRKDTEEVVGQLIFQVWLGTDLICHFGFVDS